MKLAKRMDRFCQFAMVAADEAIADSGIDEANIDPYRIGVIVSSAAGGFKTTEKSHTAMIEKGPTKCSPFTVPMLIVDMPSGHISIKHGYKGVNKVVVKGINLVTKHNRPSQANPDGGITKIEAPIHVSNVALLDPVKKVPTKMYKLIIYFDKNRDTTPQIYEVRL